MPETLKNKTCTLCTLFDNYNSILIPSLQRSYAQGRKTAHANEVRAKFLADIRETFTVRRVSFGYGVERVFPLHSPRVDRIEVERKGRVRRSKLYYLRDKVGKGAKIKEQLRFVANAAAPAVEAPAVEAAPAADAPAVEAPAEK